MTIETLKIDKRFGGIKYGFHRIVTGRKKMKSKPIYFDNLEMLIKHVTPLMRQSSSYTLIKSIQYDNKEFKCMINVQTRSLNNLESRFGDDPDNYINYNGDNNMTLLNYVKSITINKLIDKL